MGMSPHRPHLLYFAVNTDLKDIHKEIETSLLNSKYILLNVLVYSIAECPYKFAVFWRARRGESKIKTKSETKSKNTQWYHTPKRLISYLASNCSIVCAFLIRSEKRSCWRSVAHAAEQLNRFFTTQNHQLFDISWYLYSIRALFLRYLVQLDTLFLTLILGETLSEKAGQARD